MDLQILNFLNYAKGGLNKIDNLIATQCKTDFKNLLNAADIPFFTIKQDESHLYLGLPSIVLQPDTYLIDSATKAIKDINSKKNELWNSFVESENIQHELELISIGGNLLRSKYLSSEYGLRITLNLNQIKSLVHLINILKNMRTEVEAVALKDFWVNNQIGHGQTYTIQKANPWIDFVAPVNTLNISMLNLGFPSPSYLTKQFLDKIIEVVEQIQNLKSNTVLDQKRELLALLNVYNNDYGQFIHLNLG